MVFIKYHRGFEIDNAISFKWKQLVGRLLVHLWCYLNISSITHSFGYSINNNHQSLSFLPSQAFFPSMYSRYVMINGLYSPRHVVSLLLLLSRCLWGPYSFSIYQYSALVNVWAVAYCPDMLKVIYPQMGILDCFHIFCLKQFLLCIAFLSQHMCPFFLGVCLDIDSLGHMLILGLNLLGNWTEN